MAYYAQRRFRQTMSDAQGSLLVPYLGCRARSRASHELVHRRRSHGMRIKRWHENALGNSKKEPTVHTVRHCHAFWRSLERSYRRRGDANVVNNGCNAGPKIQFVESVSVKRNDDSVSGIYVATATISEERRSAS